METIVKTEESDTPIPGVLYPPLTELDEVVNNFVVMARHNDRQRTWNIHQVYGWCMTRGAGYPTVQQLLDALTRRGFERKITREGYVYTFYFDEEYAIFKTLLKPFGELLELHGSIRVDLETVFHQVNDSVSTYYSLKKCRKLLKAWCRENCYSITKAPHGLADSITEILRGRKVRIYELIYNV